MVWTQLGSVECITLCKAQSFVLTSLLPASIFLSLFQESFSRFDGMLVAGCVVVKPGYVPCGACVAVGTFPKEVGSSKPCLPGD